MKGAQERVLERCTHDVIDGNVVALTPKERANVVRRQEALSATGYAALASPSSSSILARTALTTSTWPRTRPPAVPTFPLATRRTARGTATAARSTHARAGASCSLAYPITDQAIACKVVILWSTSPQ